MKSKPAKILLTGLPGCGKTTAVMQIIESLNCKKIAGFYTLEIRKNDTRKGFRWTRIPGSAGTPRPDGDGATGILAHVDIKGRFRVGKYGVDVAGFEKSVVSVLDIDKSRAELFVIDEIGKMECLSQKFVTAIRRLFISEKSILATVAQKGSGLISEVKNYPNIKLLQLTQRNRESTISEILKVLSFLKGPHN
jgi:nucleoside-triphosphatase